MVILRAAKDLRQAGIATNFSGRGTIPAVAVANPLGRADPRVGPRSPEIMSHAAQVGLVRDPGSCRRNSIVADDLLLHQGMRSPTAIAPCPVPTDLEADLSLETLECDA